MIKANEHQPAGDGSRTENQGLAAEAGRAAAEPAGNRNDGAADGQEGAGQGPAAGEVVSEKEPGEQATANS